MGNFSGYKKVGEPAKQAKIENWRVAIGLQAVDGLSPSNYLVQLAHDNIDGKISADDVEKQISAYYKHNAPKTQTEQEKREADEVSSRINKLLGKNSFSFSPAELLAIHKYLFSGILNPKIAGHYRTYDITKDEPILNGDTVHYGRADSIRETLTYDFDKEKAFNYNGLEKSEKISNIIKFMSGIWQIHPFGEGNTRTVAVFTIKYLRTLGFHANNDLFEKHSLYFRNALVRANYQNLEKDIHYTMEYLDRFFENLLLGGKNILKNRDMQIRAATVPAQKITTRDQILKLITARPDISMAEMANSLGLTIDGIKYHINKLKSDDIIKRVGARKLGEWKIVKDKKVA
jgi:fido (protein-threonine AMPylation protein)/DNA-binding CsgD family transcriptional regulator